MRHDITIRPETRDYKDIISLVCVLFKKALIIRMAQYCSINRGNQSF